MQIYSGKEAWKNFVLKDDEMEFRLLDAGKLKPYMNNTYEFVETSRKLKLRKNEFFGIEFVLCSNTIYEVELEVQVDYPDGTDKETTMVIKNNVPQMVYHVFEEESQMMSGKWMLSVRVKDRMYDEHEQEISVFGDLYEEFKIKCIRPKLRLADDDDIRAVESLYYTQLCEDYKDFLKKYNGYDLRWWLHPRLKKLTKSMGKKGMKKLGKEFKRLGKKKKTDKVKELFGANNEKFLDLIPVNGKPFSYFYDVAFGPCFYPVGRDGDGNVLVQIAAGKNKGKVGLIDHRSYYGRMNKYFTDQTAMDPDTLIEHCVRKKYMQIFEEDFGSYFTRRLAEIDGRVERILEIYRYD